MSRLLFAIRYSLFAIASVASSAQAQQYPGKPIKLVVGFPAGGATDTTARLIAQRMQTGARADHRGREHRRRRRLDRGQAGRGGAGRRLHADDDDHECVRHPAAALQARLRSGEGIRAGGHAGRRQERAGGRAVVAGEDRAGDGGAGEGRARQVQLRLRHRHRPAFRVRAVQAQGRRRHRARAVSRRRSDDRRPDRRADPRHRQRQVGAAPAHRDRQGARARRQRARSAGTT